VDHLWSPWRYHYLANARTWEGCIFCDMAAKTAVGDDETSLIVFRGDHNFVVLNRFPYTSGHLMVVPYAHQSQLGAIEEAAAIEMMRLTRAAESHIRALYLPDGLNIGMNLGQSAGAGIAGHIHMHVLPRWFGDSNFMTTIGETRMLPEDLSVTWKRMTEAFQTASPHSLAAHPGATEPRL
jgi:ATP adenylyltransferase